MPAVQLPPALVYGLGMVLIVFGSLRAYYFGWQRREEPVPGDENDFPRRPPSQARRHISWGLIWLIMGLYLVVSTFITRHR